MRTKPLLAMFTFAFAVAVPALGAAPPAALILAARERFGAVPEGVSAADVPQKVVSPDGRESLGVLTTAGRVFVADERSGVPLYADHPDEVGPVASLTKLMTARVLRRRHLDWGATVRVTRVHDGGGMAYFAPGDVVTVRDLWRAMLIGSSNTAALTLVGASGLTEDEFVAEMNAVAAALGMTHTRFVDPTGLGKGNVSTAREISLLVRASVNDPEIREALTTGSFPLEKAVGSYRSVVTTNKLLSSFLNEEPYRILGGKTGYIVESGYNIALSVGNEAAAPIIVVVLGSASSELRFQEAKALAYWAFENHRWPEAAVVAASLR